ncbi:hypothetical protein V9L05_01350 [Bernardetia sp. Wsw4-3y2]|uniref:hypothetical protein n=1 Tax=Bernardetia sp. Wsw4-3y2 TaxID=3127471 RepID=UPI0030CD6203
MNPVTLDNLDVEIIIKALQSNKGEWLESLTDNQKALYKRCEQANELIHKWKSRSKVVPMFVKMFKITPTDAYVLYNNTQIIFGEHVKNNSKPFFVDILLEQIFEVYRLASEKNDLKEMNAANKQLQVAIEKFFPETDALLPEDINIPAIVMGFYPEELGMNLPTEVELQKRVSRILDFKKKKQNEYTDFEEIEAQNSDD